MCLCRAEYDCFQIELSKNYGVQEWRDDVRSVLLKTGLECNKMVFLFSDTQVGRQGVPHEVVFERVIICVHSCTCVVTVCLCVSGCGVFTSEWRVLDCVCIVCL